MVGQKPKAKLTVEDYLKTSEGERYELIDGELMPVASPGKSHQRTLKRIGFPLNVFVDERNLGEVIFGPRDVVLTDTYVFVPDLLFISNERARIDTDTVVQGAPDLALSYRAHLTWWWKYAPHRPNTSTGPPSGNCTPSTASRNTGSCIRTTESCGFFC